MYLNDEQRQLLGPTLLLVVLTCVLCPRASSGASYGDVEVRPFGFLDTSGSLSIRYLVDENSRESESSPTTFQNRTTWEQELFLISRSYVYHPAFLNIELGGGPLLVQQTFDSDQGTNSNNESLFNFLARFNFLDLKTYPFSIYLRRNHPSVTTSLSGRFLTRNEELGFSGRKNFVGRNANFTYDLRHRDQEGSGLDTILDEEEDRSRFSFTKNYRDNDRIGIEYNRFIRDSASGSLGLPIQETRTEQKRIHLSAQNRFGRDRQFSLDQSLIHLDTEREPTISSQQEDLSYILTGRWQNSTSVRTNFNYRFNDSERTGADARSHNLDAGLSHNMSEALRYDVLLDHEDLSQTGFDRNRSGVGLTVNYSESTGFGSYGLNGSVKQERTDQVSINDTVQVFDEPVTLNGTTPVDLSNEFVVASTVVVTNAAGTQIFLEDVDFRLIVVGSVTSIQRLIDGSIFDGQTVLVDYQYQTSGTVEFDSFRANAVASINFMRYFSGRLRYGLIDSNVLSGELTTPINDGEAYEVVLGADIPVGFGWQFAAELRHLDQDEEIAPFVRDSASVSFSGSVIGSMSVRIGAGLVEVDQKESVEDVDQISYRFNIRGRVFGLAQLAYDANYLEDKGGSLPREQLIHRLTLQGRYRQVVYTLQALYSDETLGITKRDSTQVTALVTRYFQ